MDRFVESLSAKIHQTPPSIDKLSSMFQDFYVKADASIATHIRALSTRQSRRASPNPSVSSKSSIGTRESIKAPHGSKRETAESAIDGNAEQQMLTPLEISERRKARRLLDRKAVALEEAVERRVCDRVYDRIWRHRSTLDEVRDEKLRSRTAALALVGISLQDLGITFESKDASKTEAALQAEVEDWISKARDGLLRMNEARFPLGKLQQLAAAHKCIVDLLVALHQSSSSADEILPTLIYALITTPPEGINVISNLYFIQRFRASSKVDGEAAYCLTNLEAAITFLETVDLASLRADEVPEGPAKSSERSKSPMNGTQVEQKASTAVGPSSSEVAGQIPVASTQMPRQVETQDTPALLQPTLSPSPSHHRRISDLLHPPAHAFGAASDAVRNTADHGIKTIGSTLDNSFKLLFGRLQEQKVASGGSETEKPIVVPKTLDEARKLVEPKADDEDDESTHTPTSGSQIDRGDDSILSVIAGRKPTRDRSVDSNQSSGSGKRVGKHAEKTSPLSTQTEPLSAGVSAVESMRNLGNSLNPLRGFGGMGGLRAFGRTASSGATSPIPTFAGAVPIERSVPPAKDGVSMSSAAATATATATTPEPLPPIKVAPPIPKFMETKSVAELKVGEIADLLQDYKRLARVLDQMGAL